MKEACHLKKALLSFISQEKSPDKGLLIAVARTRIPSFVFTISLSFAKSFLKFKKRLLSISNLLPTNLVTTCEKEVNEN